MDEIEEAAGIDRRSALKRGLVVAGATVWLTPTVQVLGLGQRYAQAASVPNPDPDPGPGPGPGPKPLTGKGISNIQVLFTCGGTLYYAKLDNFTKTNSYACESKKGGGASHCGFTVPSGAVNGCGLINVASTFLTDSDPATVTVTLTCAGTFQSGAGKAGKDCVSPVLAGNVATFAA